MSEPVEIAVAVVEHHGHVLIGLRPPGTPLAGYWEFPGGKIAPGEHPEVAAIRECREEAGLEIRVVRAWLKVEHRYEHGPVRVHFFAAEPLTPRPFPHAPFRWVRRSELHEYTFPPANAPILAELIST